MRNSRGNAFFITLVSVILLGTLTFVVTRQLNSSSAQTISAEKAEIYASRLMSHASEAENVLQQMFGNGQTIATLIFRAPSSGSFSSDTFQNIYHPQGGGLNYPKVLPDEAMAVSDGNTGWQYEKNSNVSWTPTSADDVIYSYIGLNQAVCEAINYKITGSTTIPAFTGSAANYFIDGAGTDSDFTTSECASCEGYPKLCVYANATYYVFYNVIAAQ